MNKIWRYPQVGHFALAFGSSWGGIFIVLSVTGFSLATLRPIDTSVVFVLMLLGPATSGLALTALMNGRAGIHRLWSSFMH